MTTVVNGKKQVLIVGAGLSGLTAARALLAHGLSVQILEAQERVGGRIVDFESVCGERFSLGGEWFGSGETRWNQLLAELELETAPLISRGKHLLRMGQQTHAFTDDESQWLPPIALPSALVSRELTGAFAEIARLAQQVSTATPHLGPPAWDTVTLAEWSQAQIQDETARKLFAMVVRQETGRELCEISLLTYLFLYRSAVRQLGDDRTVKGGTQRVIERLAAEMDSQIHLNTPVCKIQQHAHGVEVRAQDHSFDADHLILALSPAVVTRIQFHPPLPAAKEQLYANMRMGSIIKCVVTYPEPFWYAQGHSGNILSDEGPLECALDASFQTACGALIGYSTGDEAKKWSQRSREQRQSAIVEQLAFFLGEAARSPMEYREINWPQRPWIGGAYYASMNPGALAANGQALREPFGRIHWAGTETAAEWCGTLEGAVLAGERVVQEILMEYR